VSLLDSINDHWFWAGVSAVAIEAHNPFGSLILLDVKGRFWRICPEELSAQVIAASREELAALWRTPEFSEDWAMAHLADRATTALGQPPVSRTFYFVIPTVLGGKYTLDNIKHIGWEELMRYSGDLARQVENLPDGAQIRLSFED
jgi:hypothetical protein